MPAFLLTPQRKLFFKKEFYLSLALAFLLILPNLIWQYRNDFPVVHHLKVLAETQLVNVERIGFIKSHLSFFIGSFFIIVAGLYALLFYKPFQKYQPFLWAFFFTLAIFMYLKAKDYYAIGLYPVFIAFGSVFLAKVLDKGWLKNLKPIAIALPALSFIPMYQFAFPNKTPEYMVEHREIYEKLGQLRWEDGKDHLIPQDYADMLGWKELATKVDSLYSTLPNKGQILVLCDNYGQAGAINYYATQSIKAVSFNAGYVNWFDLDHKYIHLIRVKDFKDNDQELTTTGPYFQHSFLADSITNKYARGYRTKIFVFVNAKIDINQRLEMEIEEAKEY